MEIGSHWFDWVALSIILGTMVAYVVYLRLVRFKD